VHDGHAEEVWRRGVVAAQHDEQRGTDDDARERCDDAARQHRTRLQPTQHRDRREVCRAARVHERRARRGRERNAGGHCGSECTHGEEGRGAQPQRHDASGTQHGQVHVADAAAATY
jgi:hypothetical protein